jgi:hypothetical protein
VAADKCDAERLAVAEHPTLFVNTVIYMRRRRSLRLLRRRIPNLRRCAMSRDVYEVCQVPGLCTEVMVDGNLVAVLSGLCV